MTSFKFRKDEGMARDTGGYLVIHLGCEIGLAVKVGRRWDYVGIYGTRGTAETRVVAAEALLAAEGIELSKRAAAEKARVEVKPVSSTGYVERRYVPPVHYTAAELVAAEIADLEVDIALAEGRDRAMPGMAQYAVECRARVSALRGAQESPVTSTMTWIPAKPGERSTTPAALSYDAADNVPTGYVDCACRDCMEIAIGPTGTMCSDCTGAGCDAFYDECRRSDAYGCDHAHGGDDLCSRCDRLETSTITAPREPTAGMTARAPRGTTYAVTWSHGVTERSYATYEDAVAAVRSVLSDPEIGHSGDILDGGESTLFWDDAAKAQCDDGSRAAGSIVARHALETCDCGEWSGVPCDGPRQTTVEWMPPHLRESHRAAGGGGSYHGCYPSNGALRLRVSNTCAESMLESDGEWTVRL